MHKDAQRFYAALGVDPDASDGAIHHEYRRLAKILHPDAPTGDANGFIRLKRAYDVLSDPVRRAAYDRDNRPHRFAAPPLPEPPPFRPGTRRRGGVGFARRAIAFVVVAALSIGAVEAMIGFFAAPPSIQTRSVGRADTTPAAADPAPAAAEAQAPGSSKSGFWDPTPPAAKR